MSTRADIITRRTYARPIGETAFETWPQIIERVTSHQRWLWERAQGRPLNQKQEKELAELQQLMLARKALVAGRTLWLGGTDLAKKRESSQFNCSFQKVSTIHDIVDAVWLLEQGCGLGSTPQPGSLNGFSRVIPDLEIRHSTRLDKGRPTNIETWNPDTREWTIQVGDSAEGWAKAIGKLFAGKYPARRLIWDTTEIRPAGTRLAGYGWISQGDHLLNTAMRAIFAILNRRAGQLLSAMDILDCLNWFGTILATRRSAEIVLYPWGGPEWEAFAKAKNNYWINNIQRAQSNNSLLFYEKPSKKALREIFDTIIEMGGSDPGLFNAASALSRAPYFSGTNPCLSKDTKIITNEGAYNISDLVNNSVKIYDGESWRDIDNFRITATNQPMLKITLQDGSHIRTTEYHTFILEDGLRVEARDLLAGDKLLLTDVEYDGPTNEDGAYLKGFLLGDGHIANNANPKLWIYEPKYMCIERLIKSAEEIPIEALRTNCIGNLYAKQEGLNSKGLRGLSARGKSLLPWCKDYRKELPKRAFTWNRRSKLEFIAGLFDADGTALDTEDGFGYQITSIHKSLLEGVQTLLKSMQIYSKLSLSKSRGLKNIKGNIYECQDLYRLTLSQKAAKLLSTQTVFSRLKTFEDKELKYLVKSRRNTVVAIEPDGVDDKVYCCTVPNTHSISVAIGITIGQCGEVLLGDKAFCNVGDLDLAKFSDRPDWELHRALYLMARANYRQTCVDLNDGILQRAWHENNEYLRLCGVGLTGIAAYNNNTPYNLRVLRNHAIVGAYSIADELNLPRPKNVTTIKPSGTLSKIMDTTEGIHKPLGKYIFNNINFGEHDPLLPALEAAGYNIFTNPNDSSGRLVTFPVKYDNIQFSKVGNVEVNLESAVEQLERYKLFMDNYVDHNASITISYDIRERKEIVSWLDKNWDSYVGVSFLFRNDPTKTAADLGHAYLPQEVVDKARFEEYNGRLKPVDITGGGDPLDEECSTGACPVR